MTDEVDFDSIMEEMEEHKANRKKGKSDQKEIKDKFAEIYTKHFGGQFEFRKVHWYTRKTKTGEAKPIKCKSDRSTLYTIYKDARVKYDIDKDEFIEYLEYIVREGFDFCDTQRQLFGLVKSEKQIDKYFVRVLRKRAYKRRNQQMQDMAKRHAELFESQ